MADDPQETFELTDVEVDTLGLVTCGANREEFFLLKQDDLTPEPEEKAARSVLKWLGRLFKQAAETPEAASSTTFEKAFSDAPWSSPESDLDEAAFCSVCLIDTNPAGEPKAKKNCHLPVKRTPGGPYVKAALRNAAARLNQVQNVSTEDKAKAKASLARLMMQAGMETSMTEKAEPESEAVAEAELATKNLPDGLPATTVEQPAQVQAEVVILKENIAMSDKELEGAGQPTAPVVKQEAPAPDFTAFEKRQVELEKANQELLAKVEAAQVELLKERELRERETYFAKARSYGAIPAPVSELADQLYWLSKQDAVRYAWWTDLLQAVDNQVSDAGLYTEKGTTTVSSAVDTALKSADPKAALLALSAAEQTAYIRKMHQAAREV